jgi:hypothetical protein
MVAGSAQSESWMGRQGRHFALDLAQLENGVRRELLWYGGPSTPEISGGVVAKYSDGSPAITQIQSGQGFLIVSGFHPGATAAILASLGLRRDAYDHDFAWTLLKAAITGQKLKALQ